MALPFKIGLLAGRSGPPTPEIKRCPANDSAGPPAAVGSGSGEDRRKRSREMVGETDLDTLLRTLQPELDPQEFGFGVVPPGQALPAGLRPLGMFEEDEGTTVIASSAVLRAAGIEHSAGWARISLKVHSSLAAVGMTAVMSDLLTRAGISANIVAAYYHDNVFVQWDRRHDAVDILKNAASMRSGEGT
jgi:hypothetical protein